MIKNLIFDCGNVLMEWNKRHVAEDIGRNQTEKDLIYHNILCNDKYYLWDEGKLSDREIREMFESFLPEEYKYLASLFMDKFAFVIRMKDDVQDYAIRMKKKGYNIYLLSNYNIHFLDLVNRMKVKPYLSGYVYSAKNKHVKPGKEIYDELVNTYHLNKEECLFIDDMEINVLGALKAGYKMAIKFNDNLEEIEEKVYSVK